MNIKKIENLHVALWLVKDASWCSSWKALGMAMAIPTLLIAARLVWMARHDIEDMVHNIAVCLWIMANIVWMSGEFFLNDGTRAFAKVFFFAGMLLLTAFYGYRICRRSLADEALSS